MLDAGVSQAVILVGGLGTRLGSLTQATPKPLLTVAGRPFVEHLLDKAAGEGVKSIVLACSHMGEQFISAYDGRDWQGATISCALEDEPAGTAGVLRLIEAELDERFFVVNGDSYLDAGWAALAQAHEDHACCGTIALTHTADRGRYGSVAVDGDDKVVDFHEKGQGDTGWVNAGVYLFDREVVAQVRSLPCSMEVDVLPALARQGRLAAVKTAGTFIDIGLPADYERADNFFWGLLLAGD